MVANANQPLVFPETLIDDYEGQVYFWTHQNNEDNSQDTDYVRPLRTLPGDTPWDGWPPKQDEDANIGGRVATNYIQANYQVEISQNFKIENRSTVARQFALIGIPQFQGLQVRSVLALFDLHPDVNNDIPTNDPDQGGAESFVDAAHPLIRELLLIDRNFVVGGCTVQDYSRVLRCISRPASKCRTVIEVRRVVHSLSHQHGLSIMRRKPDIQEQSKGEHGITYPCPGPRSI